MSQISEKSRVTVSLPTLIGSVIAVGSFCITAGGLYLQVQLAQFREDSRAERAVAIRAALEPYATREYLGEQVGARVEGFNRKLDTVVELLKRGGR